MSRCSVCRHPERRSIEASLDLGWSQRATAERFGVSASSLSRHRRNGHSELREAQRELATLLRDRRRQERARTILGVASAAGWSRSEVHQRFGLITTALAEAEDYDTLTGWLRFVGLSESDSWEMIEKIAGMNGDDAGEVWEELYAPALEAE